MPKSKRARPVYLHGPKKKTRENKDSLINNVRAELEKGYQYVYVLVIRNMRNTYLKDVRREFADGRIFFGRTSLLRLALGTSNSTSPNLGLHSLSAYLQNPPSSSSKDQVDTCLLLTSRPPSTVQQYFGMFRPLDYARAGTKATRGFRIPSGQIYSKTEQGEEEVPVSATREPELRKLGVPTRLVKGKVMCETQGMGEEDGYEVCHAGQVLDSRQTALLKFFGQRMSVFEVGVRAYWSAGEGNVVVLERGRAEGEGDVGMEVDGADSEVDEEGNGEDGVGV